MEYYDVRLRLFESSKSVCAGNFECKLTIITDKIELRKKVVTKCRLIQTFHCGIIKWGI